MKCLAKLVTLGLAVVSGNAWAVGRIATVTVVDRDSGSALSAHYFRGEYWVAGTPGSHYAIEIRNRLGERLLAVTSVDGVNVLSGSTAAWDQEGYVFGPREGYQITGWRKSHQEVAAFTFTASADSYAARTGRPGNVGVIGVALFREQPPAIYVPPRVSSPEAFSEPPATAAEDARRESADTAAKAAPPPSQSAAGGSQQAPAVAARAPAPRLGTGHGEREYSYVQDTDFRRQQEEPNEVIRIRYDSLENLIAMGVVRRPAPRPPLANPFPGSAPREFVPDPPG
jgi:hypothetical protein